MTHGLNLTIRALVPIFQDIFRILMPHRELPRFSTSDNAVMASVASVAFTGMNSIHKLRLDRLSAVKQADTPEMLYWNTHQALDCVEH